MIITAHRGASKIAPENTLSAIKMAVNSKAQYIEIDARMTKDNIPVICHDPTINRTSNGGELYVHDLTLSELKKYDFGSWFSTEFEGEQIATLEEVLKSLENDKIDINIEIKNGPTMSTQIEGKIVHLVSKYGFENRVLYTSFDHESLLRIYKLNNKAKLGFIFHINLINLFEYIDSLDMAIHSINLRYFYVTPEIVRKAHERNIEVNVYTLDNPILIKKYKQMGADGVITNSLIF